MSARALPFSARPAFIGVVHLRPTPGRDQTSVGSVSVPGSSGLQAAGAGAFGGEAFEYRAGTAAVPRRYDVANRNARCVLRAAIVAARIVGARCDAGAQGAFRHVGARGDGETQPEDPKDAGRTPPCRT